MTAITLVQTHGNKVVSGALIVALYVTVIAAGWFLAYLPAQAAPLTSISDTLSVSVPSSASDHTILFTVTTEIPAGGSFSIDFQDPTTATSVFATGSVDFEDVDIASGGGTNDYTVEAATAASTLGVTISGSALHVAVGSGITIEAGEILQVQIGVNATFDDVGASQLTNPAAITGTEITFSTFDASDVPLDTGITFVAIQEQVTLQATVDDTFIFVVDGVTSGDSLDDGGDTADVTSTATLVPFGTLTAETPIMGASSLSVTSNAINGFVVTVEQNHDMTASSGADIDCFPNGGEGADTCGDAGEEAWKSPDGTQGVENTYGHLGLYTEDGTGTDITVAASISSGTTGTFFGLDGVNAVEIWDNDSTGDGNTQDTGHIQVIYRIEVTGLQEAGTYTNQLMYIATPTF